MESIGINGAPIDTYEKEKLFPPEYILSLADFIMNCATPMTISLQGEWGIGKTSFYNILKKVLTAELNNDINDFQKKETIINNETVIEKITKRCIHRNNVLPIETINAWTYSQFDNNENLTIIILKALINKINPNKSTIFDIVYNISSTVTKGLSKKLIGQEISINDIYNKNFFEKVESLKKEFENLINTRIKEAKKNNNDIDRVLIFIDDLDRISPDKAVELLESFKNFLDVPNCVFVFAIDYDVIVKGACKKFGEDKGQAFFDKIIKLPFLLPIEYYRLKDFIRYSVISIFEREEEDIKQYFASDDTISLYLKIIENSVGNNPRAIGRLLNSFYIMYKMDNISYHNIELNPCLYLQDTDEYEIRITELFFFFCCIRSKYTNLFNYLLNDIEKIAKKDKNEVEYYINELRKDIENHLINIKNNDIKSLDDSDIKNIRELFNIYCSILDNLNKLNTLSPMTLYAILVKERVTGGHLNKL